MEKKVESTFDSRLSRIGIVVHVYSKDRKRIAISVRDLNVVEIYEIGDIFSPNTWKHLYTLKEHSQTISTLDWSANDLLLTGSHDRSVVVWNFDKGQWRPHLVIIQDNNRAITCGGWHEPGNKFCVGTGSHKIFIGYYEKEHNWWHSKKITNFKSSILAVKFHPSGRVIATGCADFSFKLISSYIEEVEKGSDYKGLFDEVKDYGTELLVIKNGGWVESLAWNPSGSSFAYAVHTSELFFGEVTKNGASTEANQKEDDRIGSDKLPFLSLAFKNDDELIAAGHDYKPHIFAKTAKKWAYKKTILENELSKLELSKSNSKVKGAINLLSKSGGPAPAKGAAGSLAGSQGAQATNDVHQHKNPILSLNIFEGAKGNATKISTTDCNGNILFWDLN